MSQREEAIAYFEAYKQRTFKWLPPEGTVARVAVDTELSYYDRAIEALTSERALLNELYKELDNEECMYEFIVKKGLSEEYEAFAKSRKAEEDK